MWLKGNYLTVGQLLNFNAYWDTFAGGSAVIHRLAPQDYHRWPVHSGDRAAGR